VEQRDHVHHVLEQWQRELPGLDRSPMGVVGRISRLAQLLQVELERVFAAHGLTGGEFDVLASLRRSGPPYQLTPTALSRTLMVTSGGMTKRLAALEGRGLIRRDPAPHDRRSTTVALTEEGRGLVETALEAHVANERRLLGALDDARRAELATLLEALAVSLGDRPDRHARPELP
jgi:DNA-binding MarR family transcriptional regulator